MSLDATISTTTSETYCDVAFATAYFAAIGNEEWPLLTEAKMEQSLRKSTQWHEAEFFGSWRGWKTIVDQVLSVPRSGIVVDGYYVPSDSIPTAIKRSCAEMALKASSEDITADLSRGVLEKTIGPIKTVYDSTSPQEKRYVISANLLRPYLSSRSGVNVGLVRT